MARRVVSTKRMVAILGLILLNQVTWAFAVWRVQVRAVDDSWTQCTVDMMQVIEGCSCEYREGGVE